jgi:hypothetical protein
VPSKQVATKYQEGSPRAEGSCNHESHHTEDYKGGGGGGGKKDTICAKAVDTAVSNVFGRSLVKYFSSGGSSGGGGQLE